MTWLHVSHSFLAVMLLLAPTLATVCPDSCLCSTTVDGLHRAICSSLPDLYKFTLRQKHHNINILVLSHNNITKLSHELDRLTEVVTLDLSTNGIVQLNKFLNNAKKLVHLNLANNRIQKLSLSHLPASVSSLDLTNNLLKDVPSELGHLKGLEHLMMEGNPLECSCENIRSRDQLITANVQLDQVKCVSPLKVRGRIWLELKTRDICKASKIDTNYDIMMGDQPIDPVQVGDDASSLQATASSTTTSILDEGNIIKGDSPSDDDDSKIYLNVGNLHYTTSSPIRDIDGSGSGDGEITTLSDFIEPQQKQKLRADLENDGFVAADNIHSTDDPLEGSGEGSGFGFLPDLDRETTTPIVEEFSPDPVFKNIFEDDLENTNTTEFPPVLKPSIYAGGPNWHNTTEAPSTEKAATPIVVPDTTVSEKVTKDQDPKLAESEKQAPHKTGTYVCIAIIVVLLVGLIGFAIIKGQMRKRRDRRLLRQQKRDVEQASKEMVDMNKSLLGKPAIIDTPIEKKINGKYELVPTHESHQKKGENGDLGNGYKHTDTNGLRTDSPRDTNQNKSSSKDNNLADEHPTNIQDTSFESAPSPDSRKDSHSLSSEDIFMPPIDDETPRLNGTADSDICQPLINGDYNTDSDFLSPSREYVPVYSPDMGRVRIKMTETPKPKTPVLVTRSRSNAGDIIITPSMEGNTRKSTT